MLNYSLSSFTTHQCHIQGCQVDIIAHQKSFFSAGNDDVICEYNVNNFEPKITTINNMTNYQISKLAINPKDSSVIVIGTKNGYVLLVQIIDGSFQLKSSKILYKTMDSSSSSYIKQLMFINNGHYLLIATNQPYCIVYDFISQKFTRQKLSIQTEISSFITDYHDQYFGIIDYEGNVNVYKIDEVQKIQESHKMQLEEDYDEEDPFTNSKAKEKENGKSTVKEINVVFLVSYKIASPSLVKKYKFLTGSFNVPTDKEFLSEILYLPGQSTLQKVQLSLPPAAFSSQYSLASNVYCSKQILQVHCLKNTKGILLLLSTEIQTIIALEKSGESLMRFNHNEMFGSGFIPKNICVTLNNVKQNQVFAFINTQINNNSHQNNKVYIFNGFQQLQKEILVKQSNQMQENNQILNIEPIQQESSKRKFKDKQNELKNKQKTPQVNLSSLLPCFPQLQLYVGYEYYNNARFLFYNNIGCIIQRMDGMLPDDSILQLQFHDRSKLSRIKIFKQHKYDYFALCQDTLVCASSNKIMVQCEKYLKDNFIWEYEWEDILGVTIGGDWICGVNKGEIKIFDWAGIELFTVAFDRNYVIMAAYENYLAIVYHSALPMWGVQSFKMLLFEVTSKTLKCVKDVLLPIKTDKTLKWFGFSEEGMLVCQDDGQNVRVYDYQKDEWILTLNLDPTVQRLFITHIFNYEIYGFRLQQKSVNQPRVLPRSLPRKVLFDLSNYKLQYLSKEQNEYIKAHKLSIMWLEHQKYRNLKWYKYKYSRNRQNRWFKRSQTIKSEEQIKANQAKLDLRLMDYLKKFIKININHENKLIWKKVLALCHSLAYYQETKNKLSQIIYESEIRGKPKRENTQIEQLRMLSPEIIGCKKNKISHLDRLEEMMGLKWMVVPEAKTMMEME